MNNESILMGIDKLWDELPAKTPRKTYVCRECGKPGHNARTCARHEWQRMLAELIGAAA